MYDIEVTDANIDGLMQMIGTMGKITSNVMSDYEHDRPLDGQIEIGMMMGMLAMSTALCLLVRSQEFHYRASAERFNVN